MAATLAATFTFLLGVFEDRYIEKPGILYSQFVSVKP